MNTGLNKKQRGYPKIIIVGKMQAGKTTAADYFVNKYKYTKVSLASPIKDIVFNIDSLSNERLVSKFIKPYYKLSDEQKSVFFNILNVTRSMPVEFPKPRKRLQFLGTDGVRKHIDDQFWLKVFSAKWENTRRVVIDDCRFLNEYLYFTELGYSNIKIKVDPNVQDIRIHGLYGGAYDKSILEHPSELEQDKIMELYPEFIITNDGTLEEYYSKLDEWITKAKR